jgi:hypothetical protein
VILSESTQDFFAGIGLLPFKPEQLLLGQEIAREQYDVDTQNWRDMHYVRMRWPEYEFVARHTDGTILVERKADGFAFAVAMPERKTRRYVRLIQRAGLLQKAAA